MRNLTEKERKAFQSVVLSYYKRYSRHTLPWRILRENKRGELDPYKILVSEVMLQQTQVDRVIPKYNAFIKKFPSLSMLARASRGDVLRMWQGLGYNRRAKLLHQCAQEVVDTKKGRLPHTYEDLCALPGIGPYTGAAVLAFGYNKSVSMIETNIRTVFIHHFFHDETDVSDVTLLGLIEMFSNTKNPRTWYWALMDYGAYLKKTIGNQNIRSRHYVRQKPFKGSDREIRGAILRALSAHNESRQSFHAYLKRFDSARIDAQLERLFEEGMIVKKKKMYALPE